MVRPIPTKSLLKTVRSGFGQIADHRAANGSISLSDALMSGFGMFSLKDSSLLEFDDRRSKDENLRKIYGLQKVPSDTQMRTILDLVSPEGIKSIFKDVYQVVKQNGVLEKMKFLGHYVVSLDGSGYFSSNTIHCSNCLERKNSKSGEITYHHQLLAGAIVHPDLAPVIPLAPEPIIKQDGEAKNDCERNAAKRFMAQLRADHPDEPFIITEDALSANAPHIRELKKYNLRFILGVKPGDHVFLFEHVERADQAGQMTEYEVTRQGVTHRFRFINQVALNASNQEVLVNFIE